MMTRSEIEENLANISDDSIREMYVAVKKAFEHDSDLTEEEKRRFENFQSDGLYYGTDIYSDWSDWRAMLGLELKRRDLKI